MLFCRPNKLDGYIARRYNLKTVVGSIIDPAADKTLMTVMTITLAMEGVLPRKKCSLTHYDLIHSSFLLDTVPLAGVILGRDVGLVLAAFYYRYISLPAPVSIPQLIRMIELTSRSLSHTHTYL